MAIDSDSGDDWPENSQQNSEDTTAQEDLREVREDALEGLSDKEKYVFGNAVIGLGNEDIAENLGISDGYVGSMKTNLKEDEILEKVETDGVAADWFVGPEALERPIRRKNQNSVSEDETSSESNQNKEVKEQGQNEEEKYGFSEVMAHLAGEANILESEQEQYLRGQVQSSVEADLGDNVFAALNSDRNLKLINYLTSQDSVSEDSILDVTDQADLTRSEARDALQELGSVGIVSLDNSRLLSGFDIGDNYREGLKVFKTVKENIEDLDQIGGDREWTEAEREMVDEWATDHDYLVMSLFQQSEEEMRQKYRDGDREMLETENHALAEYKNLSQKSLPDIEKGGEIQQEKDSEQENSESEATWFRSRSSQNDSGRTVQPISSYGNLSDREQDQLRRAQELPETWIGTLSQDEAEAVLESVATINSLSASTEIPYRSDMPQNGELENYLSEINQELPGNINIGSIEQRNGQQVITDGNESYMIEVEDEFPEGSPVIYIETDYGRNPIKPVGVTSSLHEMNDLVQQLETTRDI